MARPSLTRLAVALAAAGVAVATADIASAATMAAPTGVDVSYPQCGEVAAALAAPFAG